MNAFKRPEKLHPVLTIFVSAPTGPTKAVSLLECGNTAYKVELTVIRGKEAHQATTCDAWDHVAGLTAAQEISESVTQPPGPNWLCEFTDDRWNQVETYGRRLVLGHYLARAAVGSTGVVVGEC